MKLLRVQILYFGLRGCLWFRNMHKTLMSTRGGHKVQSLPTLQADHHTNPQAGFSVQHSETEPVISLQCLHNCLATLKKNPKNCNCNLSGWHLFQRKIWFSRFSRELKVRDERGEWLRVMLSHYNLWCASPEQTSHDSSSLFDCRCYL